MNCSKADMAFEKAGLASQTETDNPDSGNTERDITGDEQQQLEDQIRNQIPEEEWENPRPITDLEDDPTLWDTYACSGGGVVICHFPENIASASTKCVGRSAINSHYSHVRTVDGSTTEYRDYLGPCRHSN